MSDEKKQSEAEEKANAERKRANKVVRLARKKKQRASAKANGHKLGHNNRRCKRCGSVRTAPEFDGTKCNPKVA